MLDLQRRLAGRGFPTQPDPMGQYGPGTKAAVEAFQHRRGLRVDGIVGNQTWGVLVEACYRVGDRLLYHRKPMLRGDDVADAQRRLSALGFDTGRVDGIFGPLTATALIDFQRNTGLNIDGILGANTWSELCRVTPRQTDRALVTSVRDRERLLQSPRTLQGKVVALGEEGGLDVVVNRLRRRLTAMGVQVVTIAHPTGSVQATIANEASADVYLGLRLDPAEARCQTCFYAGYTYESAGGRQLAELVHSGLAKALDFDGGAAVGMSLPVLRETRMPAIVCEIGPARVAVESVALISDCLALALEAWVIEPVIQ